MPPTISRSDHLYALLEHSNTGLPNVANRVEFKTSTKLFTLSRKSKPRRLWFGNADFSAWCFLVESISTEASQP
ncbi:hypothetical protein BHE74_00040948 [Ensete ventricosum]|nr:hypothetical protein GW17_00051740 [Ensete ventricosum]RWW52621.1 hypothetical protein BHE74_00040948 [Ensete ventricosum]